MLSFRAKIDFVVAMSFRHFGQYGQYRLADWFEFMGCSAVCDGICNESVEGFKASE